MAPRLQLFEQRGVGQAVALEMGNRRGAVDPGQGRRHHAPETVFAGSDPERRVETAAQPVRQADMVWMAMGGDYPQQGLSLHAIGEHLFPRSAGGIGGDAAIDGAPARAGRAVVGEQPQVDMVERERQRHAQPAEAGSELVHGADGGHGVAEGIGKLQLESVHGKSFGMHRRGLKGADIHKAGWRATMHSAWTLTWT